MQIACVAPFCLSTSSPSGRYPRHRQLISLNKRFTGRSSKEFNLRHDWNSLLDNEDVSPVTKRTVDRFPQAEVLAEYLREFGRKQEQASKIRYGSNVTSVARQLDGTGFVLTVATSAPQSCAAKDDCGSSSSSSSTSSSAEVVCRKLVHAGGIWRPNKPRHLMDSHGFSLALDYSELPSHGYEAFEDKKVAVFGLGNAAMETADALKAYTAFVHAFPGRGKMKFPHFAYETRYVGNVRTWRSEILDSYVRSKQTTHLSNR